MQTKTHPVDEKLALGKLFVLGMQHVLVMYAGAIAVPLIIGGALHLPKDQIAYLINADLFCCGLATLIQALGIWKFGIRMPVMMGVTFAAVGPMVAMAGNPHLGILSIYGAVIAAGLFGLVITPFMSRAVRYFPPVVTGTIITVIGLSLMRVGFNWAAGGQPTIFDAATKAMVPNPNYGAPENLAIALIVLVSIMLMTKYLKGFLSNISVLLGMALGMIISLLMGKVSFSGLSDAGWLAFVTPFHYGMPTFDLGAVIGMCLVMIVTLVESTGMFLALSELTDKKISNQELANGLRADCIGTVIGGVFNTFPYTSFSQNIGLVGVTGVRSRYVCVAAGLILAAFGLFPKMALVAASIPVYVLGGAGIVMFGMVTATGIKILSNAGMNDNRSNLFIVAISIGAGMIPLVAPQFFQQLPDWLSTVVNSGILLTTLSAILLNLFFNGQGAEEDVRHYAMAAAHSSDH